MWYVTIAVLLAETTFYLIFASGEEQSWNKKVILKEKYRFYESKSQTDKVPILKEVNFGKMQLCRVEHFYNIFVLTFGRDC